MKPGCRQSSQRGGWQHTLTTGEPGFEPGFTVLETARVTTSSLPLGASMLSSSLQKSVRTVREHVLVCAQEIGRAELCVTDRQAQVSRPVGVRSGEMPGSLVVRPPCVAERRGSKRGGATGRSAASSEVCGVVNVHRL